MSQNRRAGIIHLKVDGDMKECVGDFSYNLGEPKRSPLKGSDKVHGYSEEVQEPFIEGEIRDSNGLSLSQLCQLDGVTITLELANGKSILLRDAWYAGEGTGKTQEANIGVRFESASKGEEVK